MFTLTLSDGKTHTLSRLSEVSDHVPYPIWGVVSTLKPLLQFPEIEYEDLEDVRMLYSQKHDRWIFPNNDKVLVFAYGGVTFKNSRPQPPSIGWVTKNQN